MCSKNEVLKKQTQIQLAKEGRILVDNWTTVSQTKLFTPAE